MSLEDQLAEQFGGGGGGGGKRKAAGGWWDRQDKKRRKMEEDEADTCPAIEEEEYDANDDGWRLTLNLNTLKAQEAQGGAQVRRQYVYHAQQPEDRRRWLKHGCFLKSCKWAPDGSVLLANSEDNVLRLFNLPDNLRTLNAKYLRTSDVVHPPPPGAAAVRQEVNSSPAALEKSLEMTEGECVYDYTWYPRMDERNNCCFAASSRDHPIHLWDALSGDLRATYRAYNMAGEPTSAFSLAFSHDGATLAAGYRSTMRFFDAERAGEAASTRQTHFKIKKKKTGLCGLISCIDWSPRHQSLYAAGTFTSQFGIGDLRTTGKSVALVMKAHKGGITHLRFSRCGRYVYTAARKDGIIKAWDTRLMGREWNGKYREALLLDTNMSREVPTNQRITFDLDMSGEYLYSGCHTGVVKVWKVPEGTEERTIKVGNEPVNGVALHPTLPVLSVTTGERRFQVPVAEGRRSVVVHGWRHPQGDDDDDTSSTSSSDSSSSSHAAPSEAPLAAAPTTPPPAVDAAPPAAVPAQDVAAKAQEDVLPQCAVAAPPATRPPIDEQVSTCTDAMFVTEEARGTNNIRSTLELWTGELLYFRTARAIEREKKEAEAAAQKAAAEAEAAAQAAAAAATAPAAGEPAAAPTPSPADDAAAAPAAAGDTAMAEDTPAAGAQPDQTMPADAAPAAQE